MTPPMLNAHTEHTGVGWGREGSLRAPSAVDHAVSRISLHASTCSAVVSTAGYDVEVPTCDAAACV